MHVAVYPDPPSASLAEALIGAGFEAIAIDDPAAVVEREPADGWAAVVVEIGPDRERALSVARRVREAGGPPVLLVAGRDRLGDLAAESFDDVVLAPLHSEEVALRLRRLASESGVETGFDVIRFKDLELNPATYQARLGEAPLDLTYMEYELLRFFATHSGRVWSREQLLSRVWGYDYFGGTRTVDVHVRRLRAKLGEKRASWITTVRSVGYRFG